VHINNGEVRMASEQQRKHVVSAARDSSMTSRPTILFSIVNARIGTQENVDNLRPAASGSKDESWRPILTRQARVDVNKTIQNEQFDN